MLDVGKDGCQNKELETVLRERLQRNPAVKWRERSER